MPRWSEIVKLPGGGTAIVCHSGKRPSTPACRCGARSILQCDYPLGGDRTCDAYLCRRCAEHVGPDRDYCPQHRAAE